MSSRKPGGEATPAVAPQRFIGPQPQPPRERRGQDSATGLGNEDCAGHAFQSRSRPAAVQENGPHRQRVTIPKRAAATTTAAALRAASKKRPSRAAASLRHRPPLPPSSSIHTLLRERQRLGRPAFLARPGAGVWSPDPLHRVFAGNAHTLRRLQLSGELRGHGGCVNTVSCTPDGRYWITGSDDMKLMVRGRLISGYSCMLSTFLQRVSVEVAERAAVRQRRPRATVVCWRWNG